MSSSSPSPSSSSTEMEMEALRTRMPTVAASALFCSPGPLLLPLTAGTRIDPARASMISQWRWTKSSNREEIEEFPGHKWITPWSINAAYQSQTEKGIRKVCSEWLELKDAVESGNMQSKYQAFLRCDGQGRARNSGK